MSICENCEGTGFIEGSCGRCNGSGEGMYDGSTCSACNGSGVGYEECEECHGSGEIENEEVFCSDCIYWICGVCTSPDMCIEMSSYEERNQY